MTPERWEQIKDVFEAALARDPVARAEFLDQECAGDAELKQEVGSLLRAHDSGFMNTPVATLLLSETPLLKPGQRFGHYEQIAPIGSGGMGQVYSAVDTRLRRKVALKLLPSSFTHDADRVQRFEQEAQAASALNHTNIITIYEIGQVDSLHFIATEFVDGNTLREHIAGTKLTMDQVLDLATQIASALHAAHEAGIVHRDIKPENVMLRRDGVVKVLDFGLAKLTSQQVKLDGSGLTHSKVQTNPGVVMGTVDYMSPEQARGQDVDSRTDIWSFGVVLYEMVTGRLPFGGETPSHIIVSILEHEPPPLSLHVEVPDDLERITSKALRKNKEERYQSANDLAVDLKSLNEKLTLELRQQQFRIIASSGHTSTNGAGGQTSGAFSMSRFPTSAEYLVSQIKRHKGSAVFLSTTALLLILFLSFFSNRNKERIETIDSVAVLSFVNESGDANVEYLADGISDSVISDLSRLGKLQVISLSTVSRYKGKQIDPQEVGRELNVGAVLVGRVMHLGDSLVISSELVNVRNNSRLWGARYDAKTTDILIVQEQIANGVREALRLKSSDPEKQRLTKLGTTSSEAYEAYLRGKYLLEKRTESAVEKSVEYFQQAIKLDANYAPAYAALAYAYWSLDGWSLRGEEFFVKSKEAVTKALEIDSTLAEAHTTLGHIRSTDWDWKGAEEAFKRGLELNPNSGFAHSNYALFLIAKKRLEEAVAESKRAVELEPTSVLFNRNLGAMLYFARRYDEAIAQCQKTLELDPIMPTAHHWLAKSYEQKGLFQQAIEADYSTYDQASVSALKDAYDASGWQGFWRKSIDLTNGIVAQGKYVDPYIFAEAYMHIEEKNQVFVWLEKAFRQRRRTLKFVVADPLWDNLRSDPRYIDLVRRMRLEP